MTSVDSNASLCSPNQGFDEFKLIWQVYRLYQLTKASHFIERLMFTLKDLPASPELLERSGALFAMIVTFQVLGVVCLWSLMTFLLRLFPSRPVAEKYWCLHGMLYFFLLLLFILFNYIYFLCPCSSSVQSHTLYPYFVSHVVESKLLAMYCRVDAGFYFFGRGGCPRGVGSVGCCERRNELMK